jgi:hypothetical protein
MRMDGSPDDSSICFIPDETKIGVEFMEEIHLEGE